MPSPLTPSTRNRRITEGRRRFEELKKQTEKMLEEPGFVEQMSKAFAEIGSAMGADAAAMGGAGEGEPAAAAPADAPAAESDSE